LGFHGVHRRIAAAVKSLAAMVPAALMLSISRPPAARVAGRPVRHVISIRFCGVIQH